MERPIIGKKVKDFTFEVYRPYSEEVLTNSIKEITEDNGQWLLMIFYPKDFTFVCPTELKAASAMNEDFKKLNTKVISFSTQDIQSHKDWTDGNLGKLNLDMGYDKDGVMGKYFGIYDEENDVDWRGTFLIAPDGRIWATYILANETGRSCKEMLRFVEAGQNSFEGKMVPCEWTPGEDFLKKPE